MIARHANRGQPVDVAASASSTGRRTPNERRVRGAFLRALTLSKAVDVQARPISIPAPVRIRGALIEGSFDIAGCGSQFAPLPDFEFVECAFSAGVDVSGAHLRSMTLNDCLVLGPGIMAKGVGCDAISLRELFIEDAAAVDVSDAHARGSVILTGIVDAGPTASRRWCERHGDHDVFRWLRKEPLLEKTDRVPALSRINLIRSVIEDSVEVRITSIGSETEAIDGRSMKIGDRLTITKEGGFPSAIRGEVTFARATIGGEVSISDVDITAGVGDVALRLDGARMKNGITLGSPNAPGSKITGAVSLVRANVGGALKVSGYRIDATRSGDAICAREMIAQGDVEIRGGPTGGSGSIQGKITIERSAIGGSLSIINADISVPASGTAIDAGGATISGSVTIASEGPDATCVVNGITLFSNCAIGGDMQLIGATLAAEEELALDISRTKLKRDLILAAAEARPTEVRGTVHLVGATIAGSVIFSGVTIIAPRKSGDAVSAWATRIHGSVSMERSDVVPSQIIGETNFTGASIHGQFTLSGMTLRGAKTGMALVASATNIDGGMWIGARTLDHGDPTPTRIEGVVWLARGRLGSLQTRFEGKSKGDVATEITGALVLSHANLGMRTALRDIRVLPVNTLADPLRAAAAQSLRDAFIDERTAISATHTEFGGMLVVRLAEDSAGIVELSDARVTTLDDDCGKGWGQEPSGTQETPAGVELRLDGFSYVRFKAVDRVEDRIDWLWRQHAGRRIVPEQYFPQPYRQVAKVFRDSGYGGFATKVTVHRNDLELRHTSDTLELKFLRWCFARGFGYGYSPRSAFVTVLLLFAVSFMFTETAVRVSPPEAMQVASLRFPAADASHGWLRSVTLPDEKPTAAARSCDEPHWLYALDTTVPVVHFGIHPHCALLANAPVWLYAWKALIDLLGWICISVAALTISGFLRERDA
jgi:hypothetical protein